MCENCLKNKDINDDNPNKKCNYRRKDGVLTIEVGSGNFWNFFEDETDIEFINDSYIIIKCKQRERLYRRINGFNRYEILKRYGFYDFIVQPYMSNKDIYRVFSKYYFKYDPFYIIRNKCINFVDSDDNLIIICKFDGQYWNMDIYHKSGMNGCVGNNILAINVKELFVKDNIYPIGFIENEEDLDNYYNSQFLYEDWKSEKISNKMKEYGLGDVFIKSFSNRIDTLEKYNEMIDLANEIEDKNLFMSLFVEKFKEAKK